ncbi:MAG: inactive transglutaminase family protein [Porticoccaceae bacterium]
MSPKGQVYLFAILFILIGLGLTIYKSTVLQFPLLPDTERKVWDIEAKITFDSGNTPLTLSLALPAKQQQYRILDEVFASSGYGFTIEDNHQRRAIWTRREASGPQTLYYRLKITDRSGARATPMLDLPETVVPPIWTPAEETAAAGLIRTATEVSAEPASFTQQLLKMMNGQSISQDAQLLLEASRGDSIAQITIKLLNAADIPARMVRGIYLENRHYNQRAEEIIEIHDGRQWIFFDPKTAARGVPENFFMWQRGGQSLLDIIGGYNSRVRFSVLGNDISAKAVALKEAQTEATALVDFNIYSLPLDKQNIFKMLLLVPIGALVVVIFRVLIGLKTSGTFMPVLIALAFIQTTLAAGVLILVSLVAVGLWIRSYLSKLDMLMVARLAAVLITVVILMAGFSVLSYKLGLDQVLTITFFPMIIIAWTIERMSIIWEEEGPREVVTQGGGSLIVSIIAYLLMTNNFIEHLTYNFPEILLIELGIIMILGQYTGYRLTELKRFRFLIEK